jgi:hypothetical protein
MRPAIAKGSTIAAQIDAETGQRETDDGHGRHRANQAPERASRA